MSKATIFISYSHKNEEWKERLTTHLSVLSQEYPLAVWDDRRIATGTAWFEEIQQAMAEAKIAVLLISADFFNSKFIQHEELPLLIERREKEGMHLLPVLVSDCDWSDIEWLKRLQFFPRDGRHIASYHENRSQSEKDWAAFTREVRLLLRGDTQLTTAHIWHLPRSEDISTHRLPITGQHLFGRERELSLLDGAWADPDTNVVTLTAWSGVGKTSLVRHWLDQMGMDNYRNARRVYCYSFYRQGTSELVLSADEFISEALKRFHDPDPTRGLPQQKGERLAQLIRQEPTLLVLDGLEPLQHPPGPYEGRIKDPALAALVRELAAANQGLCVITTRQQVADLEDSSRTLSLELEHLSETAGAQLLKALLVIKGTDQEREKASREFGGHALALTLLGTYLRDVFKGDVLDEQRRSELKLLDEDKERGGHAERMLASYEKCFGDGPELSILRIIGLFDRPVSRELVGILRDKPPIPGLNLPLMKISEQSWQRALSKLKRARLLANTNSDKVPRGRIAATARAQDAGTLDTHPLVREYFAHRLESTQPRAWQAGHDRIYEYLKRTAPKRPETLEDLTPLYAAVFHGCKARRYQDALDKVFWERIACKSEHFSTRKLGAYGADLTALAGFFKTPWSEPVDELDEDGKAYVLASAGYCLRALGRLKEAVEPLEASWEETRKLAESTADIEHSRKTESLKNASMGAGNLSEIYLLMGSFERAEEYGRLGVHFADILGVVATRSARRAALAAVFHLSGRMSEAAALFKEADDLHREAQPQCPILQGLEGFSYCAFLFDQGDFKEPMARSKVAIEWARANKLLLAAAMSHLWRGQAHCLRIQQEPLRDFSEALQCLNEAVDGFREAQTQHHIPRALIARAAAYRQMGEFVQAQRDLDEAQRIAENGGMLLYLAELSLERVRLLHVQGQNTQARESLAEARRLIQGMGYHRRAPDLQEVENLLNGAGASMGPYGHAKESAR